MTTYDNRKSKPSLYPSLRINLYNMVWFIYNTMDGVSITKL